MQLLSGGGVHGTLPVSTTVDNGADSHASQYVYHTSSIYWIVLMVCSYISIHVHEYCIHYIEQEQYHTCTLDIWCALFGTHYLRAITARD